MNPKKVDCYICPVCSELMPKGMADEAEGYQCSECGDIYDNEYDAEECCNEEDEE